MLSLIAAIGPNRELGKDNTLLWHIPGDLPRFKKMTTGHPVIMGRKTYESIGRPLGGRTNIVISSNPEFHPEGVAVVHSIDEAFAVATSSPGSEEIFVIGGGKVFEETIEMADRLYLTIVDKAADADVFFPDYARFTKVISKESKEAEGLRYTYITLEV
jgi:dihydrofolate reductase